MLRTSEGRLLGLCDTARCYFFGFEWLGLAYIRCMYLHADNILFGFIIIISFHCLVTDEGVLFFRQKMIVCFGSEIICTTTVVQVVPILALDVRLTTCYGSRDTPLYLDMDSAR